MTAPKPAPFTAYLDWDPRWAVDGERLKEPCPKGHVNRNVRRDTGRTYCITCQNEKGRKPR